MASIKQYGESQRDVKQEKEKPTASEVEEFHQNADTDTRKESLHHTLGPSPDQASPGDHTHDGGDSALLLDSITITGSRGGNTALPSIISALVRLGAKDQSTP